MITLTFNLRLIEPVLATSLEGDPNSGHTYPFIPGGLLRGALISRYLAQPGAIKGEGLAATPEIRRLFLSGETCYLVAYMLDQRQKNRTLPTPLSWYKEKADSLSGRQKQYPLFDKANSDFSTEEFIEEVKQPKPLPAQFCYIDETHVELYQPETQINVHTQRERRAGRAIETAGAVFRYEALAAGQTFGGAVIVTEDSDADIIEPLLRGQLFLGGSRGAGYGQVQVENIQRCRDWVETGHIPGKIEAGDSFTVTLLSDLIIRDEWGQYSDILAPAVLARSLKLAQTALNAEQIYRQTALVGGFNRTWGLPLAQTLAIKAGSVFSFRANSAIPIDKIEQLMQWGLGERRAEGFGRMAFNWPDQLSLTVIEPINKSTALPLRLPPLSQSSQQLLQQMGQRLWRREADLQLIRAINEINLHSAPKRSQLGGLRVVIRSAMAEQSLQNVMGHLAKMKPAGQNQFEQGRVRRQGGGTEGLLSWLNHLLAHPNGVWDRIGFNLTGPKTAILSPLETNNTEALAVEYTLRLIDGVLAKAAKAEKEQ